MNDLNPKLTVLLIVAILGCAALTGCGSETTVKVQGTTTVSKGQELIDLQRALNEGAISKEDFDSLREKILKRPN
jgi:hypothetical protein